MAKFDETSPRRVIPRWRIAKDSAGGAERVPVPFDDIPGPVDVDAQLAESKQAWTDSPSVGTALDLLSSAHILKAFDAAEEPAKFILKHRDSVPTVAYSLAKAVLERTRNRVSETVLIRGSKERLRTQLNNPLLLVDLARHYSSIGQNKKADRYMQMALRFAPNHRFVLRAASRLMIHMDEPDRAHALLESKAVTRTDPWLLAAEISIATVADRKPRFFKQGEALLKAATFPANQTTELSSALATVELGHGKTKNAKQLFSQSLESPNDNALAQAEWASRLHKLDLPVTERLQAVPKTFEAEFWLRYQAKDLKPAKELAEAWRQDEPFSARPAIMGQFTASIDEDYELTKRISHDGLIANPGNPQLIQNLVFAEAMSGNLPAAWVLLSRNLTEDSVQALANMGLIAYRSGLMEVGRQCYERSLLRAKKLQDPNYRAMVLANFAREAFLAKDPKATQIITEAKEYLGKTGHPVSAQLVWERTQRYLRGEITPPSINALAENLPRGDALLRVLDLK